MKAGKTAQDYRVKKWDRPATDYKHHPEVIEGAEGGTVSYPRHIKDVDGNTHHVKDEDHEATIKALPSATPEPEPAPTPEPTPEPEPEPEKQDDAA